MRKVKVLQFICPTGFYGAEMWILALAKNLDPGKVDCRLAVTKESDNQNLEIYDRFKGLGLKAYKIGLKGRFDLKGIIKLCGLIRREKIDVVHTHGYKPDIIGCLAAKLTGRPVIATPHGFENSPDRKLRLFMKMGGIVLRYCNKVAPLSDELVLDVLRLGVPSKKVRLITNGVDLDEVEAARLSDMQMPGLNGKKTIGYVGQIAYRKNVSDLIHAFDLLHRDHPDVNLVLVGDGAQRQELETMARSLSSSSSIHFTGYRNDRLLLMKNFSLFAMTSSLEGIPRCMMEAMAMELPVAAFSIPGVDKLVIHEKTGLLARFGDVNQLKECFERILYDKRLSNEMARNGRLRVEESFSARRMAKEYTELYSEMRNQSKHP
jgi:glycosyltransferase involved in cell wall biosynthesis